MVSKDDRAQIEIGFVAELHSWLLQHHDQAESVWLVTFKKSAATRYVSTSEVLDELVAFGWTDGIRQKVDADRTKQLISPRRTSTWAKSYKERAERLIEEGRMQASGQASVEAAKASGSWDAMADVDALVIPNDLRAALIETQTALDNFLGFPASVRRNILRWIASARTQDTRQRRIDRIRLDAARNVRTRVNG